MSNTINNIPLLVDNYLNYMEIMENKSQKTINSYRSDLIVFFRYLQLNKWGYVMFYKDEEVKLHTIDLNKIKEITFDDILNFFSYLRKEKKYATNSLNRMTASIKGLWNYLFVIKEVIDKNPALKLKSTKINQKEPVYMEIDECKRYLSIVKDPNNSKHSTRNYAIAIYFLHGGFRLSELINLTLSDINKRTSKITIEHGKGDKERIIPMDKKMIEVLKDYLPYRKEMLKKVGIENNYLFVTEDGNKFSDSGIQKMMESYFDKCNFKNKHMTVHKLRHTFISTLYNETNVDIVQLQELAGHSNIVTTKRYIHTKKEKLFEAVNNNPLNDLDL